MADRKTEALCQADNEAPDVTIRVNTLKTDAETLAKQLEEKGITVRQGSLWKDALHLSRTADLGRLAEFQEGLFHVQDESSQTAVAVLDSSERRKDFRPLCGTRRKTFTMAERMEAAAKSTPAIFMNTKQNSLLMVPIVLAFLL
ncbi:MAG: hypothetical protein V8Q36_11555 [Anaerotignum sp.]